MFPQTLRRTAAVVALTAAACTTGVLAARPAAAFTTVGTVRLNAVEARLVTLINQARTSRGLAPLTVAAGTTDVARDWSLHQARRNLMYHNPNVAAQAAGHGSADWGTVGENVGRGADADSLFRAYMASPTHKANILDRAYRYLGIGWVQRPDTVGYNTQVFVDRYSTAYGHTTRAAVGGVADRRTPARTTAVATFENGWDPRVLVTRTGTGLSVSRPVFDAATQADGSARFAVRATTAPTTGFAELRVRDALDLRNATALRLRLSATTGSGKPVAVQVFARRELGDSVSLGTVTIPSGGTVGVTLAVPASAKNFRNALGVAVTAGALTALNPASLTGRSAVVRVKDVAVVV